VDHTKRRIEITVEKRRLIVLKRQRRSVLEWCGGCGRKVQMLTPDQAATIANVSSRTIYRRVEAGEMHYMETAEGRLLVCANSIELN
jgi:excisionase family DNA binding protein